MVDNARGWGGLTVLVTIEGRVAPAHRLAPKASPPGNRCIRCSRIPAASIATRRRVIHSRRRSSSSSFQRCAGATGSGAPAFTCASCHQRSNADSTGVPGASGWHFRPPRCSGRMSATGSCRPALSAGRSPIGRGTTVLTGLASSNTTKTNRPCSGRFSQAAPLTARRGLSRR
jgi:hypothetical protein